METKDVRKVLDIPDIEDYLQTVFTLVLYEVGDRNIIYEAELPNNYRIMVDIISNETLIEGKFDLAEIISHYNIGFLQWDMYNDLDIRISSYMYRPLVHDCDKDFIG